jgi:hypothetical protein
MIQNLFSTFVGASSFAFRRQEPGDEMGRSMRRAAELVAGKLQNERVHSRKKKISKNGA